MHVFSNGPKLFIFSVNVDFGENQAALPAGQHPLESRGLVADSLIPRVEVRAVKDSWQRISPHKHRKKAVQENLRQIPHTIRDRITDSQIGGTEICCNRGQPSTVLGFLFEEPLRGGAARSLVR